MIDLPIYLGNRCDRLPLGGDPGFTLQAAAPRLFVSDLAALNGKQKWSNSYSIRATESAPMRTGRAYGWRRPRRRFGCGRVSITTTPMLSTLPRPLVTQRRKPLLIS